MQEEPELDAGRTGTRCRKDRNEMQEEPELNAGRTARIDELTNEQTQKNVGDMLVAATAAVTSALTASERVTLSCERCGCSKLLNVTSSPSVN